MSELNPLTDPAFDVIRPLTEAEKEKRLIARDYLMNLEDTGFQNDREVKGISDALYSEANEDQKDNPDLRLDVGRLMCVTGLILATAWNNGMSKLTIDMIKERLQKLYWQDRNN
jgi:hypothetical protein